MNPVLKNILAVIAGIVVGSIVNMSLIQLGHSVFPIEGVDINDMEALAEIYPTLEFKYFLFPFLAHAIGTLVGAIVSAKIAVKHKMKFAMAIGFWFLLGGIAMVFMISSPIWFTALDLIVAYIPMALLGGKLATRR